MYMYYIHCYIQTTLLYTDNFKMHQICTWNVTNHFILTSEQQNLLEQHISHGGVYISGKSCITNTFQVSLVLQTEKKCFKKNKLCTQKAGQKNFV